MASGCGRPCEHQRQVPAVQGVRPVGAPDPVHLHCVGHSCCGAETSTHSLAGDSPGAVLGRMSTCPLVCNDRVMVQTVQNNEKMMKFGFTRKILDDFQGLPLLL